MKTLASIIYLCLAFGMAGCPAQSAANPGNSPNPIKSRSIEQIVIGLLKAHLKFKVGMESVPGLNATINAPPVANPRETEADALRRVRALIAEQTDYDCRIHNRWLIIVPRSNKDRFDVPGSLRLCVAPAAKGVPLRDFFSMVKAARPEEPVTLLTEGQLLYSFSETQYTLDFGPRTLPCYELLCQAADHLSKRCWHMSHPYLSDLSGNILWPLKLDTGVVNFRE